MEEECGQEENQEEERDGTGVEEKHAAARSPTAGSQK